MFVIFLDGIIWGSCHKGDYPFFISECVSKIESVLSHCLSEFVLIFIVLSLSMLYFNRHDGTGAYSARNGICKIWIIRLFWRGMQFPIASILYVVSY